MRRPLAVPPLAPVLVQVRGARRRWNARVALRFVARAIALAAGAASVVVALALWAAPAVFAWGGVVAVAAALAAAGAAARAARRAWLSRSRAGAWVDARAGLGGALATLAGAAGRTPTALLPLLVERVTAGRDAWTPRRVVPHVVPRAALAAACATAYVLLLLVTAAPRWRPAPASPAGGSLHVPADAVPRPLAAAPVGAAPAAPDAAAAAPADTVAAARDAAAGAGLAALPRALQARLQAALWGTPIPVAVARGRGPGHAAAGDRGADAGAAASAGERETADRTAVARGGAGADDGGGTGRGAGTAHDPDVFGTDGVARHTGRGRFAVGLAARVHGPTAGSRPPAGEAPAPEPDERPVLAAAGRTPSPLHRPGVPADLAPAVRAVYERTP